MRAQTFGNFISRCGRTVSVSAEGKSVMMKAYLNPIRERRENLLHTEAGVLHQEKWLLLAPVHQENNLCVGMILHADGKDLLLERLEKIYFCNEPAYLWGIAVRAQGGKR